MARRDPQATREAILESAAELFAERGFSGTSTSVLAKRAGVTKSLIHHHFESKSGLWRAVKEREFKTYFDAQLTLLQSAEPPTVELLEASIRTFFKFLQARPRFVRMLQWMLLEGSLSDEDFGMELFGLGVERIKQAQQAGAIRADVAAESILMSFFALVEHWFMAGRVLSTLFKVNMNSDDHLEHIIQLVRRSVEP